MRVFRLPLLPLVNGGRTMIDLVYVDDVAALMWAAAQQATTNPDWEGTRIYNAGPGEPVSLLDFVAAYRQVTGRAPRIVTASPSALLAFARYAGPILRPLVHPLLPGSDAVLTVRGIELQCTDLLLDMSSAKRELGFAPRYSLVDGLAETVNGIGRSRTSG
jgi:nucleoside-diphosphate-sugar epimerase